jgi:hypothetical protein
MIGPFGSTGERPVKKERIHSWIVSPKAIIYFLVGHTIPVTKLRKKTQSLVARLRHCDSLQ